MFAGDPSNVMRVAFVAPNLLRLQIKYAVVMMISVPIKIRSGSANALGKFLSLFQFLAGQLCPSRQSSQTVSPVRAENDWLRITPGFPAKSVHSRKLNNTFKASFTAVQLGQDSISEAEPNSTISINHWI